VLRLPDYHKRRVDLSRILYESIPALRVNTEAILASNNWSRNQQEGFEF
jgi:hypothetical protein